MLPKIKRSLKNFFLDEEGRSSKKGIFSMSIVSLALSATAVNAFTSGKWKFGWTAAADNWGPELDESEALVGIDSDGRMTLAKAFDSSGGCGVDGTRNYVLEFSYRDLFELGALDLPSEEYVPINLDLDSWDEIGLLKCEVSHHMSEAGCHISDHYSDDGDMVLVESESDDVSEGEPLQTLYFHKNVIVMEETDGDSLHATHLHDIHSTTGGTECHMNDHYDDYTDCCSYNHFSDGQKDSGATWKQRNPSVDVPYRDVD